MLVYKHFINMGQPTHTHTPERNLIKLLSAVHLHLAYSVTIKNQFNARNGIHFNRSAIYRTMTPCRKRPMFVFGCILVAAIYLGAQLQRSRYTLYL